MRAAVTGHGSRLAPSHCGCLRSSDAPSGSLARVSRRTANGVHFFAGRPTGPNFGLLSSAAVIDYEDFVCQGVATKAERLARKAEFMAAKEPEGKAVLRFARGSPHKMRRTIDVIRGRTYEDALLILEYLPYRATEPILRTLLSAAANAKHNLGMKKTKLYVSECFVDEAPTFKRFRCRARGRATQILKRNSHITIKVKERSQEEEE